MQSSIKQKANTLFSALRKFKSGLETLQLWMDRHHQRRQLAQLEMHELKDMGLDPADVYKEIHKPFWK